MFLVCRQTGKTPSSPNANMYMANMNDSTFETVEIKKPEQINTPDAWKIIDGEGLKVINEKGWIEYRRQLDGLTWEPFANTQIKQIRDLREKAKSEIPYKYDSYDVMLTRQKIRKYVEETRQKYPEDATLPYFAPSDKTSHPEKKLTIYGRQRPDFGKEKTTRIYMAIPENGMQYCFEALREELAANGALEKMILALNLEVLDNKSPATRVDNNAVIMYVPDSNPDTLTKISKAIAKAKQKQPVAFRLSSSQLAYAKLWSTAEFMVPLDDTTLFVEIERQQGGQNYHQGVFASMRKSIYRGYDPVVDGLPNMVIYKESLEARRPEKRNSAKITDPYSGKPLPRRLAMPGLVVNDKPLPQVSTVNTPRV